MINVTKIFTFDAAHRLEKFDGLCNNIHGHTYKLLTTFARINENLETKPGHNEGMVIDFKILKEIVKKNVIDKMDHAFIYNKLDKDSSAIANILNERINQKLCPLEFRTTAENMARWIYKTINIICVIEPLPIKCVKVVLFETPTSFAKYKE